MSNTTSNLKTSKPARSMAELMASHGSQVHGLQKGDEVEGIVKKLGPLEILLDIGSKGDALVLEFDKQNLENLLSFLSLGDKVKAVVLSPEAEEGFPVVSLRRTLDDLIFSKFQKLSEKKESFKVLITDSARGGYFVETQERIRGFLPNSQVLNSDQNLVGSSLEVQIIEFDREKKRVIFSEKARTYVIDPKEILSYIKPRDIVEAEVMNVSPYGAYVVIRPKKDVQIEGFVHISELSHDRVEDIHSVIKKGDKVKAEVLELDSEARRVNVSIKRTAKDSFDDIQSNYKLEQKVVGVVTDVKTRGITLKIDEAVNGFIPAGKIPSSTTYAVGSKVECEIVEFDSRRRHIVVSPVLKAIPLGYR